MALDVTVSSQSRVPSAGATLVAPWASRRRICGTPWIVKTCGELYPEPPSAPNQRGAPVATS